jgi:predicted TIM-barrel fold metal-dependent hydrolase
MLHRVRSSATRSIALVAIVAASGGMAPAPAPRADHHQHLFSPRYVARLPSMPTLDAEGLLKLLDDGGVQRAAVLSVAYSFANPNRPPVDDEYAMVKAENDWTSAQVARFPDRLRAFCSVNPLRPYALDEIARCGRDPRLRTGLKLHFGNSDVQLEVADHVERLRQVFTAANRARMAIVVHLHATVSLKRPYGAASARVFLDQILPAAPDVPVQIAHLAGAGGYDDPATDEALGVFVDAIARRDRRMRKVYFDVSGVVGYGEWKAHATQLAARIRGLGVDRVLFGADGYGSGNLAPGDAWRVFTELPLSPAELRTIAGNVAPYLR